MRVRRLAVRNVRGVEERELVLARDGQTAGVVIVEGPNEVGKSSLGDALDALLQYRDSSRHRDVRSLQTAGSSDGPEVEADLQAGPYHVTYRKRFVKATETSLTVHAPRGEQLAGDDAHERMEAILAETVDRTLWEALRLRQADGLAQPDVAASRGLAAALEERTGACAVGERELTVHDRAREVYQRYFTDKGGERKHPLGDARAAAEARERDLAGLDGQLAELERDIDRAGALERDLPRLAGQLADAQARAHELAGRRREVEQLAQELERCERELATAAERAERLTELQARRKQLVDELAGLRRQRDRLDETLRGAEAGVAASAEQLVEAERGLAAAHQAQRAARRDRQRAQADLDHLQACAEIGALCDRVARAAAARERLREAEALVAAVAVDDAALDRLRRLQRDLDRAEARLDAASPELRFTAAAAIDVSVDGELRRLDAADELVVAVAGAATLALPDVGELVVTAGAGTEDATAARDAAAAALDDALQRAGVADLEAAEAAHRQQRDAHAAAADAGRDLAAALDGDAADDLADRLARLERQSADYVTQRGAEPALPAGVDEARDVLATATEAEQAADQAVAAPERDRDAAREELEARRERVAEHRGLAGELARRVRALTDELERARQATPDAALAAQAGDAAGALGDAVEARDKAEAAHASVDPAAVTAQADNAEAVAVDARQRLDAARRELGELQAAVRARGGDGLFERREEVAAALERARAELRGLERRATAARRLHETLERHRQEVRERYARPLREEIVRFGRMLYGQEFDVELGEDLRVGRRRHEGLWLDVDALSVGAQEQLALLGRLACASLLAERGGLLLFDDALGSSDPRRLEALGAVLRLAGEHAQVVILTCYPERYRHVGGATRIGLT